jgi:hypothetical protein
MPLTGTSRLSALALCLSLATSVGCKDGALLENTYSENLEACAAQAELVIEDLSSKHLAQVSTQEWPIGELLTTKDTSALVKILKNSPACVSAIAAVTIDDYREDLFKDFEDPASSPWTIWSDGDGADGFLQGLIKLGAVRTILQRYNLHHGYANGVTGGPLTCGEDSVRFRTADGTCNDRPMT